MLLKFDLHMSVLDDDRTIHMYIPDDYTQSGKSYPVLYMFDGQNLFDDEDASFGTSWKLADHIEMLEKDIIVVGVECSHEGNNRLDEYGPYPFADDVFGKFQGHGEDTMDFFVNELKPYIDENYPTLPDRDHTFIGGSSCGGLMALYAALAYNEIYSHALVLSPYVAPVEDYLYLDAMNFEPSDETAIYISWGAMEGKGKHEFINETCILTNLASILQLKGMYFYFNVKPYGEHSEEAWEEECDEFLDFLV